MSSLEGVALAVTSTFRFIVDQSAILMYPTIIESGANDLTQGLLASDGVFTAARIMEDVRRNHDAMVALLTPLCPAFVIVGFFNLRSGYTQAGPGADPVGLAADAAVAEHNAIQKAKYGFRFSDTQAIFMADPSQTADDLVKHWPSVAIIDPNTTNAGTGQPGPVNIVHPTNYGHALMANGNAGGRGTIAILQSQLAALPQ